MATQQQVSRAIDDIFSSTLYKVQKDVIDQVFQIHPFFDLLQKNGGVKSRVPDGTHWEIPIQYAELNQNTAWFGRGTQSGSAEKQSLTNLVYECKNLMSAVVRYWVDDRKNAGEARIYNYVEQKINNTKASMANTLENCSLVQSADPLAMNALPTLISTTPTTGTVGNMPRASNSWMTNQTTNFTGLTIAADLLNSMTTMLNNCSKYLAGTKRSPDVILTTQTVHEGYEQVARNLGQIVLSDNNRADLGFGNLKFKGVEIFWAPLCETGKMYFLNTEHLNFVYDPMVFFSPTEWKYLQGNSLDKIMQLLTVCNLVVDNFQKHGVIYNIAS